MEVEIAKEKYRDAHKAVIQYVDAVSNPVSGLKYERATLSAMLGHLAETSLEMAVASVEAV